MIVLNILILCINLFFIYLMYKDKNDIEKAGRDYIKNFKKELTRLEDKFNSIIKEDEELDEDMNAGFEEFKKKLEEIKNKETVVNDEWFNKNLPGDIKTINDMHMFVEGIDKIHDQLMTGDMQVYLSQQDDSKKKELIIRLAVLNKKYINFKNASYRMFDNFLKNNEEVLSKENITRLREWADDDINESIKISSSYLSFNTFIQSTM